MAENQLWQERLYTPTMIQKIGDTYFLVDCWHNRILYKHNSTPPPLEVADDKWDFKSWTTLADDVRGGHTISGNGNIFLADDTEHGSLRVFKKLSEESEGFKEIQRLSFPNTRPHFTMYDAKEHCFWAWLSTGSILLKLDIKDNDELIVSNRFQLPGAEDLYIRSFSIIDNKMYFVSGGGAIRILDYKNDYSVKEITAPPEFDGMNFITKINDYFYITSYTSKNQQISPHFIRLKNLSDFSKGVFEDLYAKFGFKGTPYYISSFDGRHFITEIDAFSGYTSFTLNKNKISDIRTHARFKGYDSSSFNRRMGGGAVLYASEYEKEDIAKVKKTDSGYYIGNVYMDLSRFTGKDKYSDGDIEDELLLAAKKGKLQELLKADSRWPVFYHITQNRENLLDWLPENKNARALEIGSGCGGVTGILAEKFGALETVEISERRAKIAAYRHNERNNITIHVGNLNDMEFENKFDVITLIGVLEYAPSFTHSQNPFEDFLTHIRSLLAENGILIVAIENRLGMKYWTGAAEDHLGRPFVGLTGYQGINTVKTFSKKELADLMRSVGFNNLEWYYPFPDYKIPSVINSDRLLPTAEEIQDVNCTYDQNRLEIFSENAALYSMISAGLYDEFANSFLLVAGEKDMKKDRVMPDKIYHSKYRKTDYSLTTEFYLDSSNNIRIVKTAHTPLQRKHLNAIYENYHILSAIYGKNYVAESKLLSKSELEIEYVKGESLLKKLQEKLKLGKLEEFASLIFYYKQNILLGTEGDALLPKDISPYYKNRNADVDMNFGNVVLTENGFKVYDYEWLFPDVSKNFILWRSLLHFCVHSKGLMNEVKLSPITLFNALGFSAEQILQYNGEEQRFQSVVAEDFNYRYRRKRQPMR